LFGFKGGTAVYKILNTMNHFSEDIDLTVKVVDTESNTSKDKVELDKLIHYKRMEEQIRVGRIDENLELKDFSYLKLNFCDELVSAFVKMQDTYVLSDEYIITIDDVINSLRKIVEVFQ